MRDIPLILGAVGVLALVLASVACGKGDRSSAPVGVASGSADTAATGSAVDASSRRDAAATLTMTGVRLLQPEAVIEQRLSDASEFGDLLKAVADVVANFDAEHPGAMPDYVDIVVVARSTGTRVWLVGPNGDIAAPGLETEIARMPKVAVTDRQVAAIVSVARAGAPPSVRPPTVPAAWRAAAGPDGADVDSVIDKVWPR